MGKDSRIAAIVVIVGALLGLVMATYSTLDYAAHLDRQLHNLHCSVIPGAGPKEEGAEGCRAAMYSAYSAIMKGSLWGGLPISLFAQGSFAFFAAFAVYLAVAGARASRMAMLFFALTSVTPTIVSLAMGIISATQLGTFCQTCIGIYLASFIVTAGGLLGLLGLKDRQPGKIYMPVAWLAALTLSTVATAAAYAAAAPDHTPYLGMCGELKKPEAPAGVLVDLPAKQGVRTATLFEDPLCTTCKAVHLRLNHEGILENLNAKLVLFPLDSTCNWMLQEPLHPGACTVSKAVICGGPGAKQVLEWAYEEQDYLARAGRKDYDMQRKDEPVMREVIRRRWGDQLLKCIDDKATAKRLEKHLQFAVDNSVPVSTPQIYLGKQRLCDEDTDLGLRFTMNKLAPELLE